MALFLFAIYGVLSAGPKSEADIDALIAQMTVEEKVGQMTQIGIDDFVGADDQLNADYCQQAIVGKLIGSILNTYDGKGHPAATWATIQSKLQSYATQTPLKIPILYGLDSIHGATFVTDSTLFPQEIGMAATFNPTLAETASRFSAYETRAASVPWTFAPVCDMALDVRWSRMWEDFGEDPYLSGQMAAAYVRGFQNGKDAIDENHVAACVKHYIGYGSPVSGKDRTPAVIPEIYLREYHLPSFQAAIDAGALSIMVSSGIINGVPTHMDKFLLTDLLKNELKFDGVVVTDWGDIENICIRDHVAETVRDAIALSINAGVDMSMVPYHLSFADDLVSLVNDGTVPIARINDAVRRILRMKMRLNLWDIPFTRTDDYPNFGSDDAKQASYDAAAESITMLKNDNTLPLKKGARILVTGPNADSMRALEGGWSWSWQGNQVPNFAPRLNLKSIQAAIADRNGASSTVFIPGVSWNNDGKYYENTYDRLDEAVAQAANVDYIVFCGGENSYTEKPGDQQDMALDAKQQDLLTQLIATKKPVILALVGGRPRIVVDYVSSVKALFELYLPGSYGGDAFADILFGTVNPSGKLPYNYPAYPCSLIPYHHKRAEEQQAQPGAYDYASDYAPLAEFGKGLSYTTFKYSGLTVDSTSWNLQSPAQLTVSVTVSNSGTVAGKEVVLLFSSDLYASVAPDVKRLRAFQKVDLAPGASQVVTFKLSPKDLSFINVANKRVVEAGDFELSIGVAAAGGKVTVAVTRDLEL